MVCSTASCGSTREIDGVTYVQCTDKSTDLSQEAIKLANMNYTAIWKTIQELQSIGNTAPTFFAPAVAVSPIHMPLQLDSGDVALWV